jgi:putative resolvase
VERQAGRVAEEAGDRGVTLDAMVTEVGSGVHGDRARLRKILADPRATGVPGSVSSTGKRHSRPRAAGSSW